MDIDKRIKEMKNFQSIFIDYIDNEDLSEENYQQISMILSSHIIQEDKLELKPYLSLIQKIFHSHRRSPNFFTKMFKVLSLLSNSIKQNYTNYEIFNIFKKDKRILLFLLENNLLTIDAQISNIMNTGKYKLYHYPEYFKILKRSANDDDEMFDKNCHIGENENYICQLIQNDEVEDFISHVAKTDFPMKTYRIEPSIFETNPFLLKRKPTLIEYATFYGSIQIFSYLKMNGVDIESSLWEFAVHSNNAEIIQLIEDNGVAPIDPSYKNCLKEAIKCHHNNIAEYIDNNKINHKENEEKNDQNKCDKPEEEERKNYKYKSHGKSGHMFDDDDYEEEEEEECKVDSDDDDDSVVVCKNFDQINEDFACLMALKYHNYKFFSEFFTTFHHFIYSCRYGHFFIVRHMIQSNESTIDVNKKILIPYHFESINETGNELEINNQEDKQNIDEWTHWDFNLFRYLLRRKQDRKKEIKSKYKEEEIGALHLVVENEDIEILKVLLNHPKININSKLVRYYDVKPNRLAADKEIKTSLHIAIEKRNLNIVKLLLRHPKIDVNYKSIDCYPSDDFAREIIPPILIAVENEDEQIVDLLAKFPSIEINWKYTYEKWWEGGREIYIEKSPLQSAIEKGNFDIFKSIISNENIDLNDISIQFYTKSNLCYLHKKRYAPIHVAIENKRHEILNYLLHDKRIDVNLIESKEYRYFRYKRQKQLKTPLFIAIEMDDVNMVKDLLSRKEIDVEKGLINIGGGSSLSEKCSRYGKYKPTERRKRRYFYHTYNEKDPEQRNAKTRRGKKVVEKKFCLNPLVDRNGYCDNHGNHSYYKQAQLDKKFMCGEGEEDVNDNYDVKYKIFDIISPIEIAEKVGNDEIIDIMNDESEKLD